MADTKVTALTELTAPASTDLVYAVANPGSTPLSRKLQVSNLLKWGHNVLHYGALGNSNYSTGGGADDTTAFQNAINDATGGSGYGVVLVPGSRTYRITAKLTITNGCYIIGLGSRDSAGNGQPPFLIWDGATADGNIFSVTGGGGYALDVRFENLAFISAASITNKIGCCVRFETTARPDSGTGFRNCWFQRIHGNAVEILAGATNFFLEGGRFDSVYNGYGIYVDLSGGKSFTGTIYGNTNWVGGADGQGSGFLYLNGEGSGAGNSHTNILGLHTENNQNLTQTFASGTNPSDKQGVIRFGVDTGGSAVQHTLTVDSWFNGSSGGLNSYSSFLITATSGTDAAAAQRVRFHVGEANAIHYFVSSDGASTNEIRLVGGKVPTNWRYAHPSARQSNITWGYGPDNNGDAVGGGVFQRPGSFAMAGLALWPSTNADVDSFAYPGGAALAYVTDATSPTQNGTYTSGGSAKALIAWNGSAWKVFCVL